MHSQKHHRQPMLCVRNPPIRGATITTADSNAPYIEVYNGRFRRGKMCTKMVKMPETIPAEASPVIARPMMNTSDDGAAAQTIDPAKNIDVETRNSVLTGKIL